MNFNQYIHQRGCFVRLFIVCYIFVKEYSSEKKNYVKTELPPVLEKLETWENRKTFSSWGKIRIYQKVGEFRSNRESEGK